MPSSAISRPPVAPASALPACRRAIRATGSSIRAIHPTTPAPLRRWHALVFSSDHLAVTVHGRTRPDGGYWRAVVGEGMGMPPDAIEAADRRLAGVESFTIAPSTYLGHYVAGNLAARHGIHVYVMSNPRGPGLLAGVDLPPGLVVHDAPAPALPAPPTVVRFVAPSATMSRPVAGV